MVYALLFLILLGWTLNAFSRKYELYNVTYKRKLSETIVEIDQEFEITTTLENNKLLPVTFLQVVEKIPSMLNYKHKADVISNAENVFHRTSLLLRPFERVSRSYTVVAKQRGRYAFNDATLIVGDLLGLNTSSQEVQFSQEIVVLPKPLPIGERLRPYGDYYGDISVRRWIIDDPVLLTGVREYSGAEPERTIHWPSSLKSGRLMVKKFDYTTDNSVLLLLNIESAKPFWFNIDQEKIEKCISLARGVVDDLEQAGIPYGLATNAQVSDSGKIYLKNTGTGIYHYSEVLESLGRMIYGISLSFEDLLWNFSRLGRSYTTIVLITPTVFEPYLDGINRLSEQAVQTVLISLDEKNLEYLTGKILKYCA